MKPALFLMSAVLCMACGDSILPSPPAVDVVVTRQIPSFREPWISAVTFLVTNRTPAVVYLPRCGDRVSVVLEQLQGSTWTNAAAAVCPANLRMDPFQLAPGGSIQSEIGVPGTGRFRLRTGVSAQTSGATDWRVCSAAFDIF